MAMQMQKAISNCKRCIQHEGTHAKVPVWAILVTAPLELLHMDFTSIEMTMELDQLLNMENVLVFCKHVMKHIMAYMTADQTAKTVTKFLWQGYISIFGTPDQLLSEPGGNFKSSSIKELCELIGIWKVRTSPYHAQTNEQVEQADQILMCMIGKLSKDWKVDLPKHLPKIGTCLHGHKMQPALPDAWLLTALTCQLLFPHDKGMEKHQHVDHYIPKLHELL